MFFLIPLLIVFSTSLETDGRDPGRCNIFDLPMDPSFAAWAEAWTSACTGRNCEGIRVGFWNSVKILIPSVIFSIVISAINGYALAQWRFKGSELILGALDAGRVHPLSGHPLPDGAHSQYGRPLWIAARDHRRPHHLRAAGAHLDLPKLLFGHTNRVDQGRTHRWGWLLPHLLFHHAADVDEYPNRRGDPCRSRASGTTICWA